MLFSTRFTALFASLFLVSGCDILLNASFEADTAGDAPRVDIPGAPSGDSITSSEGKSFFVTSQGGLVAGQAMAFVAPDQRTDNRTARSVMRSATINSLDRPIYISWNGKFGAGGELNGIFGYLGKQFVRLQFSNGDILLEGRPVGRYRPGDNHQVLISLYPVEGRYRVAISGDVDLGRPFIEGAARSSLEVAGSKAVADFTITPAPNAPLVYVMDDVKMSHQAP